MSGEENLITAEDPGFAMIPYWVLHAVEDGRISRDAIALYAVLRKYANNETGDAYPSRATLARVLGYKDPKSLSKPIGELERLGALEVKRRRLERFVNHYRVIFKKPSCAPPPPGPQHVVGVGEENPLPRVGEENPHGRGGKPPRVGEETPHGVGEETPHELYPSLTKPKELEKTGAEPLFEASASTAIAVPSSKAVAGIAERAYDKSRGALSYMGIFGIASHFVKVGYTPQEIESAMAGLWQAGRAVTKQTVGQTLQGIIRPGQPQQQFKTAAEKRMETTLRNAAILAGTKELE